MNLSYKEKRFCKRFDDVLLYQSIIMITFQVFLKIISEFVIREQVMLLRECIRVRSINFPINKLDMTKSEKMILKFTFSTIFMQNSKLTIFGVGMISDLMVSKENMNQSNNKSIVDISGLFLAFFTVLTLMLYNSSLYVESIGFLSVMIEVLIL